MSSWDIPKAPPAHVTRARELDEKRRAQAEADWLEQLEAGPTRVTATMSCPLCEGATIGPGLCLRCERSWYPAEDYGGGWDRTW